MQPATQRADKRDIGAILADTEAVELALKQGLQEAMIRHKRLGQSIFVWRDGRVVEIPPEEIPEDIEEQ